MWIFYGNITLLHMVFGALVEPHDSLKHMVRFLVCVIEYFMLIVDSYILSDHVRHQHDFNHLLCLLGETILLHHLVDLCSFFDDLCIGSLTLGIEFPFVCFIDFEGVFMKLVFVVGNYVCFTNS